MVGILGVPSTRCVQLVLSFTTVYSAWENFQKQAEDTFTHEYVVGFRPRSKLVDICSGEHREHRIFQQLLQMIPGLEERLLMVPAKTLCMLPSLYVKFKFPKVCGANSVTDTKRLFYCQV